MHSIPGRHVAAQPGQRTHSSAAKAQWSDKIWERYIEKLQDGLPPAQSSLTALPVDKYPSTAHLPFSPQVASDDIQLSFNSCSWLSAGELVITEKLDGANCCFHLGKVYARTHTSEATHVSFNMLKEVAPAIGYLLPQHLALFGENMAAIHSIEYHGLKGPFYPFAALDCVTREWLSWDETEALAADIGLPTVPVLFRGKFPDLRHLQKWVDSEM
ncbi:hypothetical protein WJX72_004152 [[Myrmecia] bisecta]|uniref:RNA ligase domain-containing protein n=1 Tax=[Myrmecia] bisecta TaxID=41462 RepID=A0AAW1QES6_9CHLO